MSKRFIGVYPSIESLIEKINKLLGEGQAINQMTLVTNKDREAILHEFQMAVPLYENRPILLEKTTWLVHHTETDDIFSLEKYGLSIKEEQDHYNQAMSELTYVLLLGENSDENYWYPKKRLGQHITDTEGNKEFNHQSDFINSGSANSDIISPRYNGTYNNQPWFAPDSNNDTTRR